MIYLNLINWFDCHYVAFIVSSWLLFSHKLLKNSLLLIYKNHLPCRSRSLLDLLLTYRIRCRNWNQCIFIKTIFSTALLSHTLKTWSPRIQFCLTSGDIELCLAWNTHLNALFLFKRFYIIDVFLDKVFAALSMMRAIILFWWSILIGFKSRLMLRQFLKALNMMRQWSQCVFTFTSVASST